MERKEFYSALYDSNNYLEHHGVDGQKWGKRNGPPYPLNSEGKADLIKQRKAEKKREKKEAVKKVLESPAAFDVDLEEKLKGKNKNEATKIIRKEAREYSEALGKVTLGRIAAGSAIGAIGGAAIGFATGGPIGAAGSAVVGTILSAYATIPYTIIDSAVRQQPKSNTLNDYYDKYNIDRDTERRLNV
jgi:hypothetical protein